MKNYSSFGMTPIENLHFRFGINPNDRCTRQSLFHFDVRVMSILFLFF